MNVIVTTISTIVIMIFLGFLLKKINLLKETDVESFNKLVINIFMPCMIFYTLFNADLSEISNFTFLPVVPILSSIITGLVAYSILKYFNYSQKKIWSVLVTILICNSAFLGFPVNLGVFGTEGLIRAIFCDIGTLISFLILSFVLFLVFGGSLKSAIRRILLFPPLWAVILGLIFNFFSIPVGELGENVLYYLSGGAIPLIMISLGLSLDFSGLKWNKSFIAFTSFFKLIFFPFVAFFIISFFNLSGLEFNVALIQAALPSGMLGFVLAITYDLEYRLTSDCILFTTVFSLISLPILISLLF